MIGLWVKGGVVQEVSDAERRQILWALALRWQRKGIKVGLRSYSMFVSRPYVGLNVGIVR